MSSPIVFWEYTVELYDDDNTLRFEYPGVSRREARELCEIWLMEDGKGKYYCYPSGIKYFPNGTIVRSLLI